MELIYRFACEHPVWTFLYLFLIVCGMEAVLKAIVALFCYVTQPRNNNKE